MKDRHLRARLPSDEYLALKAAADAAGMTISEYVRNVLLNDRQAVDQDQFMKMIDGKFVALLAAGTQADSSLKLERLLVEVLMLTRELAADRNAQILGRVKHQINQHFHERK